MNPIKIKKTNLGWTISRDINQDTCIIPLRIDVFVRTGSIVACASGELTPDEMDQYIEAIRLAQQLVSGKLEIA
jgi:tellurite resistance protein